MKEIELARDDERSELAYFGNADGPAEELEQCQHGESRPEHPRIDLVRIGREVLLQAKRTGALKPDDHQDRQERTAPKETGT